MGKKVTKQAPFSITDSALNEIKNIMQTKSIPADYGLRVGIKGGAGCGGVSFVLGFDREKEGDDHFLFDNVPVFMEKKHAMFLAGKEIDFENTAEARGFTFN
jgi:iron-sulfur cluster assembly protein